MYLAVLSHCKTSGQSCFHTICRKLKTLAITNAIKISMKSDDITIIPYQIPFKSFTTNNGPHSDVKASGNTEKRIVQKINLLPPAELESFTAEFHDVINDLMTSQQLALTTETNEWVKRVITHNVPHGKLLRPILLLAIARETQAMTEKVLRNLNKIAWAYEFGCATIHDDMMDGSLTRRGQPCWYLVDKIGQSAINDGEILQNASYLLLKQYVRGFYSLYGDIIDTLHESYFKLLIGQSIDGRISQNKEYHLFTLDVYKRMMELKNSYYTFYAPISVGLLLNGISDPATLKEVENVSLKLGLLYSIQDDFIDCFVDPEKSGKVGTDIQDGKPSWLIVTALTLASKGQRQMLLENFGLSDPENVAKVKTIYNEINIPTLFSQYEKNAVDNIVSAINKIPEIVPQKPILDILDILNGRTQ